MYKTIYEILRGYSKEDIDYVLSNLKEEERQVILNRFGNDLENPDVNKSYDYAYYKKVLPLIKRKLEEVEVLKQLSFSKRVDDICLDLGISEDKFHEILKRLRDCGFNGERVLYSDGGIKYVRKYRIQDGQTIITDTNEDELKFLLISDTHFGGEYERLDLVNQAFEYCSKNGINIILCAGDLIDGINSLRLEMRQMEHFIKDYPKDKNIVTLGVVGNHDIDASLLSLFDIIPAIRNYREDIIINSGKLPINIKNEKILLCHKSKKNNKYKILMQGHSHIYSTELGFNRLKIVIPALSDVGKNIPGMVEMTLKFKYGKVSETYLKHIVFNGTKDILAGEFNYNFNINNDKVEIENTEDYKLKRVLK